MHRWLAFGYALTVVTLFGSIAIARGAIPQLDSKTSFLISQALCVALLPSACLIWAGAKRSTGKLRKLLAFATFGIDLLLAVGGCLIIFIVVAGNARFDP